VRGISFPRCSKGSGLLAKGDHAGHVEKTKSRAEKQPRQGRSEYALERTLAQIELRPGRTEKKVTNLEKNVKKVEAERDEFKALYSKAVGTIRERDKQVVEADITWLTQDTQSLK
jgi:hypothetical protein